LQRLFKTLMWPPDNTVLKQKSGHTEITNVHIHMRCNKEERRQKQNIFVQE